MGNLCQPPSPEQIAEKLCSPEAKSQMRDKVLISYADQNIFKYTKLSYCLKYRGNNKDLILSKIEQHGNASRWKKQEIQGNLSTIMSKYKNDFRDRPNFQPSRQLLEEVNGMLQHQGCQAIEMVITECITGLPPYIMHLSGYTIHEAFKRSSPNQVFNVIVRVDLGTFFIDSMSPQPCWYAKSYGKPGQFLTLVQNMSSKDIISQGMQCKMAKNTGSAFQLISNMQPTGIIQSVVNEARAGGLTMPGPGGQAVPVPAHLINLPWEQQQGQPPAPQPPVQQPPMQQQAPPMQRQAPPMQQPQQPMPMNQPPPYAQQQPPQQQQQPPQYNQQLTPEQREANVAYQKQQLQKAQELRQQLDQNGKI